MKKRYLAVLMGLIVGVSVLSGCAATPESSLVKQKGESAFKNYKSADDTVEASSGDGADGESAEESDSADETSGTSDGSGTGGETSGTSDGSGTGGETSGTSGGETSGTADESGTTGESSSAALPVEEGSTAGTGNAALRERLGAPETYQSEVKDATGNLTVNTDAKILLPDAEKLNTITVTQHTFDQAAIDTITAAFFPGGKVYDGTKYSTWTKAEIQAKLDELNGYVAAGNLDPYNYGTDENGNLSYDIYASIETWQNRLESAPEERVLEEVKPQFGLSYTDGKGAYTLDNYFNGIVEMPDGVNYVYQLEKDSLRPMSIKINRLESDERSYSECYWLGYDSLKSQDSDVPGEQELEQEIGISLEEAKQKGDEILQALGISDMAVSGWEYQIKYKTGDMMAEGDTGYDPTKQKAAGYMLHYTHKIDSVPVTYNGKTGGAMEDMDSSETETWGYEQLDLIISSRGIEDVAFENQYDIGDVQTENVELLPFSDIIQTYEKMMLVQNADMMNGLKSCTYTIDRIELGYGRIYQPHTDSRTGLLVPVWTFFGNSIMTYDDSYGEETTYNNDSGQFNCQLCINAVDGSIIDVDLGY